MKRVKGKGRLRKAILALGLCAGLLLNGCGAKSEAGRNAVEANDPKEIVIGMSFDSFVIERWEKDRDVFVDTASSLGATVNVQNANGDVQKQIEQIDYLIETDPQDTFPLAHG